MSNRPMLPATRTDAQDVLDVEIHQFDNRISTLDLQNLQPARRIIPTAIVPNLIQEIKKTSLQNQSLEKKSEVEVFFTTDRKPC